MEPQNNSFNYANVHLPPEKQIGMHQQDTWELSYVIVGAGKRVIGDTTSYFTNGDLVFIPPCIPHCWFFDKGITDTRGRIANITLTFETSFLNKCADAFPEFQTAMQKIKERTEAVTFNKTTSEKIIRILKEMRDLNDAERIPYLLRILLLIANNHQDIVVGRYQEVSKNDKRLNQINDYIICNAQRDITIDEIAKYIGMNRSSFCIFFKKVTGKTFITYLNEYRIELVCQKLKQQKMNISEACFQSGFNNITYFNRVFKQMKGISPSEYIKKGCS